ncbi:MAG: hypothetical protein IT359_05645 [Gemmatimonadaceae bacterium]|nr:hypothetical protein [Gemmatimonadaceae bacterium]
MQRVAAPKASPSNDAKVQSLVEEFLAEKRKELAEEATVQQRPRSRGAVIGTLALLCAAAWLAPYPSSSRYAPPDPKVTRASGRLILFLAAQSVTHFRVTQGRLPNSLFEAGVDRYDIRYIPGTEGSFTLSTKVLDQTYTFDSSAPIQSYLGQAEDVISATGH